VSDVTFVRPDLSTFARLDELGLEVVGQCLERDRAVLACRVAEPDEWCRRCGCQGSPRDTVTRRLAHEPLGWRPTTLLVTVRRYRCTGCGHVWRQDTSKAAAAAGEALASGPALGVGRDRVSAPECRPRRRRPGSLVEHRQRRCPGRGQACPHREPRGSAPNSARLPDWPQSSNFVNLATVGVHRCPSPRLAGVASASLGSAPATHDAVCAS